MDFSSATGAANRVVSTGERNGAPTHIVRASRSYAHAPQVVWAAISEKANLQNWFSEVTGDFVSGGRFSIKHNADGMILTCDPAKELGLTWEFGEQVSWVHVSLLSNERGETQFTLAHENATDPASAEHWATYGPGATGVGWEMALLGLEVYLNGDGTSILAEGMDWLSSLEGKSRLRTWAKAWGKSHISAGCDIRVATDMAKRTANFYTGDN